MARRPPYIVGRYNISTRKNSWNMFELFRPKILSEMKVCAATDCCVRTKLFLFFWGGGEGWIKKKNYFLQNKIIKSYHHHDDVQRTLSLSLSLHLKHTHCCELHSQCDQIAILFVQFLAVCNIENFAKGHKLLAKLCRLKILPSIQQTLIKLFRTVKFCQSGKISANLVTLCREETASKEGRGMMTKDGKRNYSGQENM